MHLPAHNATYLFASSRDKYARQVTWNGAYNLVGIMSPPFLHCLSVVQLACFSPAEHCRACLLSNAMLHDILRMQCILETEPRLQADLQCS